jgi:hypothetical protein
VYRVEGKSGKENMMLRKQILTVRPTTPPSQPDAIDIAAAATVLVTSEAADHPIDNVFDTQRGPGGSRWLANEPGEQVLMLVFDTPQTIRHISLEIEEREVSRAQELQWSVSCDEGQSYREVLRQEYNFSPPGTTFEKEEWLGDSPE